ncbi:nuclear transport factor 2 family protein [Ruegeria atlantica]|uniref:nuclear transport factor 2 family protein n=1 Tax=Ruegeria atlantica TaxID=81569 RepID=UPI0014803CD4|nr:nuclear transport factor 2 family protein [Ruegeria atlantica]
MKITLAILLFVTGLACSVSAHVGETEEEEQIFETYLEFAAAQNARDLDAIGSFFVDDPDFLWVSDGQSVWGRDATLGRMSSFQRAEHWQVLPQLDKAEVIFLDHRVALLHMPLDLEIGNAASLNTLPFLVSIVFRNIDGQWRIAAMLTTNDKTPN